MAADVGSCSARPGCAKQARLLPHAQSTEPHDATHCGGRQRAVETWRSTKPKASALFSPFICHVTLGGTTQTDRQTVLIGTRTHTPPALLQAGSASASPTSHAGDGDRVGRWRFQSGMRAECPVRPEDLAYPPEIPPTITPTFTPISEECWLHDGRLAKRRLRALITVSRIDYCKPH